MKTAVTLWGLNEDVTYNESDTFVFTSSNGDTYEESAITEDGRLIAFDEACSAWVQLAPVAADVMEIG